MPIGDDSRRLFNHLFQKIIEYSLSEELLEVTAAMPQDIGDFCHLGKEVSNDPIGDEIPCVYEINLVFAGNLKSCIQQLWNVKVRKGNMPGDVRVYEMNMEVGVWFRRGVFNTIFALNTISVGDDMGLNASISKSLCQPVGLGGNSPLNGRIFADHTYLHICGLCKIHLLKNRSRTRPAFGS